MKKIILGWMILVFMVSCAHGPSLREPLSEGELLATRAALLWEAKKKNDWNTVKTLVDPEIRDEVNKYIDSQKSKPDSSTIISYKVRSLEIEGEKALVVTEVSSVLRHPFLGAPTKLDLTVRDRWVKRKGVWYVIVVKPDLLKVLESFQRKKEGEDQVEQ